MKEMDDNTRRKILKGEKTRRGILERAVNIASVEGLNGLTIGKLADDLSLSKSGLYAHFGSKEELQMSTVRHAREIFYSSVIARTEDIDDGILKLYALASEWMDQIADEVFDGGSFFAAVCAEFDDRPGRVRDLIEEVTGKWSAVLEKEARLAVRLSELKKSTTPRKLVFRIQAFVYEANRRFRFNRNDEVFAIAGEAILEDMLRNATELGRKALNEN